MGRSRRKRAFGILGAVLTIIGAAVLLAVGAYYVYAAYAESQLSQLAKSAAAPLDKETIQVRATPTPARVVELIPKPLVTPTPTPTPVPLPPKRIAIPSIDVDARVVPVTTVYEDGKLVWATASHAVGHHEGSANPGEASNIIMSGHISSPLKGEGSVFKKLPQLKLDAEVILYTEKKVFRYKVVEVKVIKPEQTEVMEPTPYPVFTLITCVPDWVYTSRLIVLAEPVSEENNVNEPPFDDSRNKHP